jgi:putative Ca2+/H+ antiporter (TMEM165/GDT1 family)
VQLTHITCSTVCVSQFPCFSAFLAIYHVLQCAFIIFHLFQWFWPNPMFYSVCFSFLIFFSVSCHIPCSTVCVSHFLCFSAYLAIYQVLQCTFIIFQVFSVFLAIYPDIQCVFLIFHLFQCFCPYNHVLQCAFLIFHGF